ncbi:MAG: hypothetical protein PHO91_00830 [Patescibacteria group bacterium]|nr:hypothetical protein [Patescibacteria group bacterium]
MLDFILIFLAVLSTAFIIWLVFKKLPKLKNINVDNLPETKLRKQKEAILTGRLARSGQNLTNKIKDLSEPLREKAGDYFLQYYQKLKKAEKDLRRRGHEKLANSVGRSQTIEQLLTQAKQALNQEEYQQAEDLLLDALSIDQYHVDSYKLLAEVYRGRKEYVQAKETLEYLLKLTHNEDAMIYSSLADIAKERGNLKQAEEDYLKSISLSQDNYLYFLSLAEVYLDLEEREKALDAAKRALVLSPNNPKILDFLINISIIMQDKELAGQYLERLKEVNPENKKIIELAEEIDNLK